MSRLPMSVREKEMLKVPQTVFNSLMCTHCGGYLNTQPLMVNRINEQFCGKCFESLPKRKKSECVRQIGLEAVAKLLIFPCRYHVQGCKHTLMWEEEKNHEDECPYKYMNVKPVYKGVKLPQIVEDCQNVFEWESEDLKVQAKCENIVADGSEETNRVKFRVDVTNMAMGGRDFNFNSKTRKNSMELEGLIALDPIKPKFRYCYANICSTLQKSTDHVYESVSWTDVCNNCKTPVHDEIYHCLFGHNACRNCKGNTCPLCFTHINREARSYCKNHLRGCKTLFPSEHIKKHEIDCDYNDVRCPAPGCQFWCILSGLCAHLQEQHSKDFYVSSETSHRLTNIDKYWFCYCYDKLFVCKYYYLIDSVEFLVEFLGRNEEAADYKYEVNLKTSDVVLFDDGDRKTKRGNCLGWNEVALGRAVTFRLKEYDGTSMAARMCFDVTLCILH